MSFTCSEVENMSISTNYYEFIKQMYEYVTKYIKRYKTETSEYYKKILKIQEKYDPRLKGMEELKKINNIETNHIISLSTNLFTVISVQIKYLNIFLKEVEDIIKSFDKTLKEKNTMSSKYLTDYTDCKNNLQKKYKDIEKAKNIFFDDAQNVENLVYKFYTPKNPNAKDSGDVHVTKSQIDSSIKVAKKHETEYTNLVKSAKSYEDKFFELTENSIDNMKRISCEIIVKMKDNIVNFLLNLKNCFKLPLGEVDTYLPELINLDENKKIEEIINSSYKKDNNLIRVQPEKYEIKLIQDYDMDNNDDEDSCFLIEDEEIIKTVKKMEESFNLIAKGSIEGINSQDKLRCRSLTYKLLSFSKKIRTEIKNLEKKENNDNNNNNKDDDKNYSISDDEVKELLELLKNSDNRSIFLKKLNNFRRYGNLEFPTREFYILCNIFNQIAKDVKQDKKLESQLAIVILSETYYRLENDKKIYILTHIKKNKIFHDKDFWNDFINKSILKEVQRSFKNDLKNHKADTGPKKKNFEKLVFAQILPIIKTMVEFELEENILNEILNDLVSYYKIDDTSKQLLFEMINIKSNANQNEIKDKCRQYSELSCIVEDENEYSQSVFETVKSINNLKKERNKLIKIAEEVEEIEEDKNNIKEKKEEKKEDKKEEKKEGKNEDKKEDKNEIDDDDFEEINKEMIVDNIEDDDIENEDIEEKK